MSWKETCVMSEGVKLMTEHLEGGLWNYGVIAGLWGESEDGVQVDWALRKRRVVGAGGSLACVPPPR